METLHCIGQDDNCVFQWTDLKTVRGYLNRLKDKPNVEFQIAKWRGYTCGRVLAIKSKDGKYWDYRVNEYRDVSELVNMDLTQVF